ncbi:PH domain-containing protein [Aquisphaera insulae]|uniref:PH domain-containing protein n=1 Tax=Aquisphaera insulae TaxID=2712864 RepID=UPI0013E9A352|nr:PH domain-containing protein [Aquisphaera insulae]
MPGRAVAEGIEVDELPENVLRGQLGPSERLLWAGQPRQGILLRAIDALLIPFSILWGGFAIFWEASVIASGAPIFFAIWGVPFVLVGLYIIFGRFWVDARQRAATAYGVTSERVIIASGVFSRSIKSLSIDTLTDVSLTERAGGGGTIMFGPRPPMYWFYAGAGWPGFGPQVVPSFELADEARAVYEIIRTAQREAKTQLAQGTATHIGRR